LSFVILLVLGFSVYVPLRKITDGAKAFASGNLNHTIEVATNDEMGYLADTLNVMAAELRKNEEYQKKFISNISHDFRSPLTSIKGFTEAMTDGTIPPELHEKYLGIIAQETERLEKLTNSVLTLENMDMNKGSLSKSVFDINSLLKKTAAVFEGSCRKKKISIDLVLTGPELSVNADYEKIEQVIYNLLDNAIKFSEKGSEIKLETTIRHGKCEISVKDEGCGIPAAELSHIWDRFYKSDSSRGKDRKGSGLGLSIVKEIVSAHNQTISVVSTVNVGTEFIFTLDLA
ncbi:MAG: HAMP domain-containing histidine kinase, partial [Lachnospiraceae bacterium]|nr:HAMP domain-containing histidine kinase [Lachnospiraceae bacterium]